MEPLETPDSLSVILFILALLSSLWDLSFPTREWTRTLNSENAESWPLDHQGSHSFNYFKPVKNSIWIFYYLI